MNITSIGTSYNTVRTTQNFGQGKVNLSGLSLQYLCGFLGKSRSDISVKEFVKPWEKLLPDNSSVDFYLMSKKSGHHCHFKCLGPNNTSATVNLYYKDRWEKNQQKVNSCLQKIVDSLKLNR